jgi:hypothetical protein
MEALALACSPSCASDSGLGTDLSLRFSLSLRLCRWIREGRKTRQFPGLQMNIRQKREVLLLSSIPTQHWGSGAKTGLCIDGLLGKGV